jgi:hypothetical protein
MRRRSVAVNSLASPLSGIARWQRDSRGQATFEFMLVLPLFILLVLFAVDMAIIGYQYVTTSNAVREGARFASVNCGDGSCSLNDVQDRTRDASGGLLDPTDPDTTFTIVWGDTERGGSVMVRAEHEHALLFFPVNFPVASCAVMRLEADDGGAGLPPGTADCS